MKNSPCVGGIYKKDEENYILISFNSENNFCQFIPFDKNIVIGAAIENVPEKHLCNCSDYGEVGENDPNCQTCHGDGIYYLPPNLLFSDFTFIAKTIRKFLIKKFVD